MTKLLGILILILAVILFPPASLAVVSNNAVPGDTTYPIKRGLEDVIYAIASLNSTSKAWFSAVRSDRRFREFSTLIAQGKSASDTLEELVAQTQVAAEQLKKINDPIKKQELIAQLSESIDKYSQKLEEVSITSQPSSSQLPVVAAPTPTATRILPTVPSATPGSTPAPQPTEVPSLMPNPSQVPSSTQLSVDQEEIDEAKEKLEDIKDRLKEEKSHQEKREDKREDREDDDKEKGKEKSNKDSDRDKKRN